MPYVTQAEVEDYIGTTLTGDANAVTFLLREAQRDIDFEVGGYLPEADGSKFGDLVDNPKDLEDWQIVYLKNAVCAQAEFRIQHPYDFFVEDQRESTSGPDYTETGKLPTIGPKARRELIQSGLLRHSGRVR